ncbi:MAG: kinase [Proteobacteria bacterium]|nr:kinase [Pseudomonadota bacterium]
MLQTMQWIDAFIQAQRLPAAYGDVIRRVHLPLACEIAARRERHTGPMLIVGLCGAQGSGKTTMAQALAHLLADAGLAAVALSLDDFYLGRKQRAQLARAVHPLLATRGVPGTHDVSLGRAVFAGLRAGEALQLPCFDKGRDEPWPRGSWMQVGARPDVLLFEGWCVGARPQAASALLSPVNELERDEDRQALWRTWVNGQLAGDYQRWFAELDMLVLLRVPEFAAVLRARHEQEVKLRQRLEAEGGDTSRLMDEAQLVRFVSHFERLTRHILEEMPTRAQRVIDAPLC